MGGLFVGGMLAARVLSAAPLADEANGRSSLVLVVSPESCLSLSTSFEGISDALEEAAFQPSRSIRVIGSAATASRLSALVASRGLNISVKSMKPLQRLRLHLIPKKHQSFILLVDSAGSPVFQQAFPKTKNQQAALVKYLLEMSHE
jgi:hypothetical protein